MKAITGKKGVSIRSIAQHLGLSNATVSLALNGRSQVSVVSESTRRQVLAAAKELGYPLERLRSSRPLLERVAVLAQSVPNPVYAETILELCRKLNQHRIKVLIQMVRSDHESCAIAVDLHRRQEVEAAIFVGSRHHVEVMPPPHLPSIFVGEVPEGERVWQVRVDNEAGGRSVGEYLWAQGHRKIAVLASSKTHLASERRLQGFSSYLLEKGEILPETHILRVDIGTGSEAEIRETVVRLLHGDGDKTETASALFCFNDWIAARVLKILRGLGVCVPGEMSVVGFDDTIYAELLDPPLTTVHHPFGAMGSAAADLLLEQTEVPNAEPKVINLRCPLIVRSSTSGPPP